MNIELSVYKHHINVCTRFPIRSFLPLPGGRGASPTLVFPYRGVGEALPPCSSPTGDWGGSPTLVQCTHSTFEPLPSLIL